MKKHFITISSLLFILTFSFQIAASQDRGQFTAGGGILYGSDLEDFGVQVIGTYSLTERIRAEADFVYWLLDDIHTFSGQHITSSFYEINASAHYFILKRNRFNLYGLATLGIHSIHIEDINAVEIGNRPPMYLSETKPGIGVGAGIETNLRIFSIYSEPRYFFRGIEQFTISAGIRIPF